MNVRLEAHRAGASTGLALGLLALLALGAGCRRGDAAPRADAGADLPRPSPTVQAGVGSQGARATSRVFDFVANLSRCEVTHRGALFDLGSPSVDGLEAWRLTPDPNVTNVEREGATWARVAARHINYRFVLDEPRSLFVSGRMRGLSARSASVSIDGKSVGGLSFGRNQTRTVSTQLLSTPLTAGSHTLQLRFAGSSKAAQEPFAEIDWLRLGVSDDDPSSFAAPTLTDVIQERVAFQKVPHRSIALRAPSNLRCTLGVPPGASLRTSVGLLGSGEGEVEIRVLQDGQISEVAKTTRVVGGDGAAWQDLDLPLEAHGGQLVTLELAATGGARGARVLFGDPMVVGKGTKPEPTPRAKAVIIVVISSINPARLPPWAPDKPLPTFDALAREGAVFERHRSPSTVPAAVMASLLTGLTPRQHALEDPYARLPPNLPTLATVSRDASIRTGMFTAVPSTFDAFGFARGWDSYIAHSPVSPAMGTSPIDDLIAWLNEHGKRADKGLLAVAHTRGIHPPYDVTPGEFAQLPPENYSGPLDARRAGQVLERLRRKKKSDAKHRWTDNDTTRLNALIDAAMAQTDRSLSNLIDTLHKNELWDETLLIVTSDVASAAGPIGLTSGPEALALPFAEHVELSEEALRVPLYVHFPGGAQAGKRVGGPTTAVDIARTALSALGIEMPGAIGGVDLHSLAAQGITPVERPLMATLPDHYAVRWGELRLLGHDGAAPALFDLSSDPKCEHDARETLPTFASSLFRFAYDQEALARRAPYARPRREPATLDPDTAAAQAVWGH
jgi:arylsulfatase A-like enzyme